MKTSQKRRIHIFAILLTVWTAPGCSNSLLDDYGYLFGIALVGVFICLLIGNNRHHPKKTSPNPDALYKVPDHIIPCGNHCINVYKDKQLLKIGKNEYQFKEIKDFHVEKIKTLPDVANHMYTLSIQLKREKEAMQRIDLKIKEERAREMAGFLALLLVKKDFMFPGDADGASSLFHQPEENNHTSRQYVKQSSEDERLAFEDEDYHEMWQQQEWEDTQDEEEERLWRQEEEDYFYLQQQEEQEEEDWLFLQDEEDEP